MCIRDSYNIIGDTQDLYHVLYEGDDCNNLTELYCSDDNNSTVNGLTVGNNYLIRVYSFGSAELTNSTFDICVFTVPPPSPPKVKAGLINNGQVPNSSDA